MVGGDGGVEAMKARRSPTEEINAVEGEGGFVELAMVDLKRVPAWQEGKRKMER